MYVRTWSTPYKNAEENQHWDLFIDDKLIKKAFVVETDDGFQGNYPKLTSRVFDTLEHAKRWIEFAPPISHDGMAIGKHVESLPEDDELISLEEAGKILGVKRFRVNAMIANGTLAAKRDGEDYVVSRSSVLARLKARGEDPNPAGRFANIYLLYLPNALEVEFILTEIDVNDTEQVERASAFVKKLECDETKGSARLLSYHATRQLFHNARQILAGDVRPGFSTKPLAFEEFLANEDTYLSRVAQGLVAILP